MAKARKFLIEKGHVAHAAKEDPDVAAILPPVGYVVFPIKDKNARPKAYKADGFDIMMLTDLVGGSTVPLDADKKKGFLLIGTDFSKNPAAIPYQKHMTSKGISKQAQLVALVATDIHHEAIHARIMIDAAGASVTKATDLTMEYVMTFLHFNRQKEGRQLVGAISALATHVGLADDKAAEFAVTEFEKFMQEKFAFARVGRRTPGFQVKSSLIADSYFRRFVQTLEAEAGSRLLKMKTNSHFMKTYAGLKNTAEKALKTLYEAYDKLLPP